jgi:glycosyl transferase family 7 (putative galactosyltransferase)
MATCPMPWLFFWGGNSSLPLLLARELGGFDEAFKNWGFEDVELGYRLWKRRVPFTLRREACGFHYPHPTGSDDRRFENMYQFLRKHPEPYPELNTFASTRFQQPGAARVRWEVLDRLAAPPPAPPEPPRELAAALLRLARERGRGPLAWFGEWPTGETEAEPEHVSRPFHPDAADGRAALAGFALPQADGTFSSAVALDYWVSLSDASRRFLCAELTRVAGTCLFASTTADAPLAAGPEYAVEVLAVPGAQVQLVSRAAEPLQGAALP